MRALISIDQEEADGFQQYLNDLNERCSFRIGRMQIRPFYKLHVLWFFNPGVVIIRVLANWASNVVSILLLLGLNNQNIRITGGVLVFVGSLNLHLSHGFAQYPSVSKWCSNHENRADARASSESFEYCRDLASFASNGDMRHRWQWPAILLTLPFTVPLHVASLFASLLCCVVQCTDQNQAFNPGRTIVESGGIGILLGCLFFPIIYVAAGNPGVIYAQIGLDALENLYDAMFSRKSFWKFLSSFVLGIFEVWIVEADVDVPVANESNVEIPELPGAEEDDFDDGDAVDIDVENPPQGPVESHELDKQVNEEVDVTENSTGYSSNTSAENCPTTEEEADRHSNNCGDADTDDNSHADATATNSVPDCPST